MLKLNNTAILWRKAATTKTMSLSFKLSLKHAVFENLSLVITTFLPTKCLTHVVIHFYRMVTAALTLTPLEPHAPATWM